MEIIDCYDLYGDPSFKILTAEQETVISHSDGQLEKKSLLAEFTKHQLDVNYEYGYEVDNITLLPLAYKVVNDGLNILNNGGKK
jgi:hypothetical protein